MVTAAGTGPGAALAEGSLVDVAEKVDGMHFELVPLPGMTHQCEDVSATHICTAQLELHVLGKC